MQLISGLWNRHIGSSSDYRRGPSTLDEVANSPVGHVAVGAGAGAALGAVVGYGLGMNNLLQDQVTVVERTYDVQRPVLIGADYDHDWTEFQNVYDSDGNFSHTNTIHHPADWDPIVEQRSTGLSYTRREFEHSRGFGPMTGAAVGLGVGAVAGGAAGVLSALLHRDRDNWGKANPKGENAPKIGAAVGAAAGGTLGAVAGLVARSKAESLTQTFQEPIFERQTIGHIPRVRDYRSIPREYFAAGDKLYYDRLPVERYGQSPFPDGEAIVRSVPTGDFKATTITESSHRLNPVSGALLGMGIGAVGGFAAGVAVGVLQKTLDG